ncbi:MAG: bifunctional oligoribonuclease/PAP phosphatase NrnA [Clostridia bacterium]|nr:bifunctional oligoribonuclease/PAP phosphatase NrnA [Clostridia bacterium]
MDMLKIADAVKQNSSIAIIIHVNPDSDCLGSASALITALRCMGKKAHIFVDSPIPGRLSFLADEDYFASGADDYDVCIAVDVAAEYMMGSMKEKVFDKSPVRCCIDHHGTNKGYAQYNCIDPSAAAAGEIMYVFIRDYLKVEITADIALRLYAAIASDTGSFQYSNTTARTHIIASELMAKGIDAPFVMRTLFERKRIEQLKLRAEVIENLKFYNDGKICVAVVDNDMLSRYKMAFEEADDIAGLPRSIIGVEVGVYIKVKGPREIKASLRSNEYVDVSSVAASLGGGGHIRAAGVTINASQDEAEKMIIDALEKVM